MGEHPFIDLKTIDAQARRGFPSTSGYLAGGGDRWSCHAARGFRAHALKVRRRSFEPLAEGSEELFRTPALIALQVPDDGDFTLRFTSA